MSAAPIVAQPVHTPAPFNAREIAALAAEIVALHGVEAIEAARIAEEITPDLEEFAAEWDRQRAAQRKGAN